MFEILLDGLTTSLRQLGLYHSYYDRKILGSVFRIKPLPPLPPPPPPTPTNTLITSSILSPTAKNFVRCAGLSGTLAICLGVYGAHVMKDNTPEELRRVGLSIIISYSFISYLFSYFNWHKHIIYFIQLLYLVYH